MPLMPKDKRHSAHHAAEIGREDMSVAILSSFGAMLAVVDDSAQTPCELAAEQNHPKLAAQLEARALLYSDPWGKAPEHPPCGYSPSTLAHTERTLPLHSLCCPTCLRGGACPQQKPMVKRCRNQRW